MRRAAALLILPLFAAAAAGCGSSSSSTQAAASNTAVIATGKFGAAPKVTIPAEKASAALYTKTIIQGSGAPLTTAETLLGNFVLYDWSGKTHKLLGSTYTSGSPTLFAGQMLPGLEKALIGQKAGSRVIAVIPPKEGFGSGGNSQIGVSGTDTLVFVVDMIQEFVNTAGVTGTQATDGGGALPKVTATAGKAPTVTIPSTTPPKALQVKTLIKGTGPKVTKGQYIVVQYTGLNWRTKKVFDSSWSRSEPTAFNIGVGQVIKGWDTGIVGQTVGSRVLLVIPPADGYGKTGSSTAGIKGTDTITFVVDILGASA
ncbi:MAG TPA: FKBP-type peptidyl-prolyl cis-trans isomerase [Trebonia sp.]|nr:FKBP-type peptidyl-prolyl cis-trans isomerase [Trebonia sp.]